MLLAESSIKLRVALWPRRLPRAAPRACHRGGAARGNTAVAESMRDRTCGRPRRPWSPHARAWPAATSVERVLAPRLPAVVADAVKLRVEPADAPSSTGAVAAAAVGRGERRPGGDRAWSRQRGPGRPGPQHPPGCGRDQIPAGSARSSAVAQLPNRPLRRRHPAAAPGRAATAARRGSSGNRRRHSAPDTASPSTEVADPLARFGERTDLSGASATSVVLQSNPELETEAGDAAVARVAVEVAAPGALVRRVRAPRVAVAGQPDDRPAHFVGCGSAQRRRGHWRSELAEARRPAPTGASAPRTSRSGALGTRG